MNRDDPREVRIEALLDAFFAKSQDKPGRGDPRGGEKGNLITGDLRGRFPMLEDDLRRELNRLIDLRERRRGAMALERSGALLVVATAILSTYARMKAERGALDFDDLIGRALALLTQSSAAWVLHKLDYGLDHLLLDEAQDAAPPQWRILAELTSEFFAGAGARGANRTVFAVGDEKQSIFGFRGAAPEMLAEMKRLFAKRHSDAERPFADVLLTFSFRSSQTILDAVDMTFSSEAAWRGVAAPEEPPPRHLAIRRDLKGVVELWPPIAPVLAPDPEDWRLPLDHASPSDPQVLLAHRIASVIKQWVSPASGERVVDPRTGGVRPIRESDVMILVRSRNAFFESMVRALKAAGLKAAGADRLTLKDHIAVMDLIAAGRAALLPDDDLTLASVLKSPLIGLDEDTLLELAARRSGSLAEALAASDDLFAAKAARSLAVWRNRARALSPFAFYALLLGEDGGRRALAGRLGPEAADPIDEFLALALAHERREAPSLHNFLAEVEAADAEIKRDMEVETEGVRVLTVHASKGLEAPIVFLPDTCTAPNGRQDPKLMRLAPARPNDPPLYAWAKSASLDASALADARTAARKAAAGEHRRLLYVAMTRAAQRLIVAGYDGKNARPEGCWYNLVRDGLADSLVEAPAPFVGPEKIWRYGEGLRAEDGAETPQIRPSSTLPGWLVAKAAPELAAASLSPSRVSGGGERDRERVQEGRLAHALLELLPGVPPHRRASAADEYLDRMGGGLAEPARAALAAKVLAAIDAPELRRFFGPDSRAEVPLVGLLPRPGRPDLPFSGRLDRLVAAGDGVSIVDFKLGAKPDHPTAAHVGAARALSRRFAAALSRGPDPRRAGLSRRADAGANRRRGARGGARGSCGGVLSRLSILCKSQPRPANPRGSNGLAALMRSHLLAKFARDGERNASGRAPKVFVDWYGEAGAGTAWRGHRLGCRARRRNAARRRCFCGRIKEGAVGHGSLHPSGFQKWRKSSVAWRMARQPGQGSPSVCASNSAGAGGDRGHSGAATACSKRVFCPCRPRRRQGEPNGQGLRDGHDHKRRPRPCDGRSHVARRPRQGHQDRHGRLGHCLARQPGFERQGRPRMDKARSLRRALGA